MKLHQLFCILPLLPLFPLLGCSGGGSDSADDHNPGDPPSPEPQASAWLFLDGPCYARTGEPFTATLSVLSPPESGGSSPAIALTQGPGKPWTFELLEGPAGLSLDPISGAVFWVPAIDSSGGQAITVRFSSGAETHEETLTLMVEGVQLAASQFVHANAGGTVTVLDIASPMYGTSIVIPAGAMEADGEIRAHSVQGGVTLPAAAQGFDLSPSQNFAQPVRIEYHYTDEWVADLGIASEFNIALFHRNEATGDWEMLNTIVNPTLNIARATTTSFSSFALFVNDLDAITGPLADSIAIWRQICGNDQPSEEAPEDILDSSTGLYQAPELISVQGDFFRRSDRNVLLLHGLNSHPDNFETLKAYAVANYDNVLFYKYPSGMRIRHNATWLARELWRLAIEHEADGSTFSCIDMIGHSMGGLVARALIEDPNLALNRVLLPVPNLVTLATPHTGSGVSIPWFSAQIPEGMQDLIPDSPFLAWLNGPESLGQGWSTYYPVAGLYDSIVSQESAIPEGIFTVTHSFLSTSFHSFHSDIHQNMDTNGVSGFLLGNVVTRRIAPELLGVDVHEFAIYGSPEDSAWAMATATVSCLPTFFLPPAIAIRAEWRVNYPDSGCEEFVVEKQLIHLDPEAFPNMAEVADQLTEAGLINSHLTIDNWYFKAPGSSFQFTRIDEDIPHCYSTKPPIHKLWIIVGDGSGANELPLIELGPFQ